MADALGEPPTTASENPRTTRMREAVLDAVIELVLTEGAGAVTALRVSEQAGVARSTVYEHWPTPDALLLDAIDRVMTPHTSTAITGDLEADLTAALNGLRRRLANRPFLVWFATLLDHANRDRTFATAQRRFVNGVLQPVTDVLGAAKHRGELADDLDVGQAAAQLAAPILIHHVMLRGTASDALVESTTKHFVEDAERRGSATAATMPGPQ